MTIKTMEAIERLDRVIEFMEIEADWAKEENDDYMLQSNCLMLAQLYKVRDLIVNIQ